jgi:hypothetical protein
MCSAVPWFDQRTRHHPSRQPCGRTHAGRRRPHSKRAKRPASDSSIRRIKTRSAIALAGGNEAGIGKSGLASRLTEPDVPPVFAHVLPLTGSDFRTRLQPAAVAAVFIGAPPNAQDGADALAAAFGLRPAETRVSPACSRDAPRPRPPQRSASPGPTTKTHLEQIFQKIRVTRQAELMRHWIGPISPTGSNM